MHLECIDFRFVGCGGPEGTRIDGAVWRLRVLLDVSSFFLLFTPCMLTPLYVFVIPRCSREFFPLGPTRCYSVAIDCMVL